MHFYSVILFVAGCLSSRNKDLAGIRSYAENNKKLVKDMDKKIKAVFIGDSITRQWEALDPAFFSRNNYVGRGVDGQTTMQMMLRFRQDVINLNPETVVINGGTNDIAENLGVYNRESTLDNIKSMAEIALANGIGVVLTSALPAAFIPWRYGLKDTPTKVMELNEGLRAYAEEKNIPYADYHSVTENSEHGLIDEYTTDGVHVSAAGYKILENVIKKILQ